VNNILLFLCTRKGLLFSSPKYQGGLFVFQPFFPKEDFMKKFMSLSLAFVVAFAIAMVGCSKSAPTSSVGGSLESKGTMQLSFKLNKAGLAKSAQAQSVNVDSLIVDFVATGEVPLHYNIPIASTAPYTASVPVTAAAKKPWSVTIRAYSARKDPGCPTCPAYPTVVYSGFIVLTLVEGTNPPTTLSLDALYSTFQSIVSPIPDSVTEVQIYPTNNQRQIWADTTFAKFSRPTTDSIKQSYDWLQVTTMSQDITIMIKGIWGGNLMPLYSATVHLPHVTAGVDTSYAVKAGWIGPSSAVGQTSINVYLGMTGKVTAYVTPTDSVLSVPADTTKPKMP
jgi:hypothetical protein